MNARRAAALAAAAVMAIAPAAVAAIALVPATAGACPFCASTGSASNAGYLIATVILIALPVTLLGGFVHWLRRHERAGPSSAEGQGPGPDVP